jgi:hypothetical protein
MNNHNPLRSDGISLLSSPIRVGWVYYHEYIWADLQHAHVEDNPHRDVTDTGTKWVTNVLCFF